jgi:predicted membrane GTPase involved in stress response
MSNRKGTLLEFKDVSNRSRLVFHAPSRGLMVFIIFFILVVYFYFISILLIVISKYISC